MAGMECERLLVIIKKSVVNLSSVGLVNNQVKAVRGFMAVSTADGDAWTFNILEEIPLVLPGHTSVFTDAELDQEIEQYASLLTSTLSTLCKTNLLHPLPIKLHALLVLHRSDKKKVVLHLENKLAQDPSEDRERRAAGERFSRSPARGQRNDRSYLEESKEKPYRSRSRERATVQGSGDAATLDSKEILDHIQKITSNLNDPNTSGEAISKARSAVESCLQDLRRRDVADPVVPDMSRPQPTSVQPNRAQPGVQAPMYNEYKPQEGTPSNRPPRPPGKSRFSQNTDPGFDMLTGSVSGRNDSLQAASNNSYIGQVTAPVVNPSIPSAMADSRAFPQTAFPQPAAVDQDVYAMQQNYLSMESQAYANFGTTDGRTQANFSRPRDMTQDNIPQPQMDRPMNISPPKSYGNSRGFAPDKSASVSRFSSATQKDTSQSSLSMYPKERAPSDSSYFGMAERSRSQFGMAANQTHSSYSDRSRSRDNDPPRSRFSDRDSRSGESSRKPLPIKLFVGNLSDDTTADDIYRIFSTFGEVKSVDRVALPKKFAFVFMDNEEEAVSAVQQCNQMVYKGYTLVVEESVKRPDVPKKPRMPSPPRQSSRSDTRESLLSNLVHSAKVCVLIRNLPEQTTKQEIATLCNKYGNVQGCVHQHLPHERSGTAIVKMKTEIQAGVAARKLNGIELYSFRLQAKYPITDEDLKKLA